MKPDPSVCFIIPVHNEDRTLEKCLKQVFRQGLDNFEVYVILDRCSDNSEKIASKFPVKIIKKRTLPKGESAWGEVVRYGIDRSEGDILIWLDADIIIPDNTVKKLIDKIHGSTAMASCKFRSVEYNSMDKCMNIWNDSRIPRGGFKVISRKVYNKLGGLDDVYACDTAFDIKYEKAGYNIYIDPTITVLHDRPMNLKKWLNQWIRRGMGGQELGYPIIYNITRGIKCLSLTHKSLKFLLLGMIAIYGIIIGIIKADTNRSLKQKVVKKYIRSRLKKVLF